MTGTLFVQGIAMGFCIAVPVGPIGVLCLRRSLAQGMASGLMTGLGAATADACYGAVAGFGLTAVSTFLVRQGFLLGLVGGLFLCYLGVRTFRTPPATEAAGARGESLLAAYGSTFLLTITNPLTILSFVGIFAGFGMGSNPGFGAAGFLVAGVFTGSAVWWLLLSGGLAALRSHVTPGWLRAVNRISGALIFAFGVGALLRLGR